MYTYTTLNLSMLVLDPRTPSRYIMYMHYTMRATTGTWYWYPGGTPLQKSFKIRSWVPSPQMP